MYIKNKSIEGNYFQATNVRIQKIENTQPKCDEVLERLFGITDINKFISTLENELFFEIVPRSASEKLYDAVKMGNLTQDAFEEEYIYSGTDGFIAFCTMLEIL